MHELNRDTGTASSAAMETEFDVEFHAWPSPTGLRLAIIYATDLFALESMRRLLGHWAELIQQFAQRAEARLSDISMVTPSERHQLLEEWTHTASDYPADKTLIGLFLEQAARTPTAEALVAGQVRLTYADMQKRAGEVAQRLRQLGVGKETLVGLCVERSWELVAGVLGILKAGAAYVPLDPLYPAERVAFMLEDAQVAVLLTQAKLLGRLPSSAAPVLLMEEVFAAPAPEGGGALPPLEGLSSRNLAYVIYTSGSTGRPKGVALEHRGAVALVSWAQQLFTAAELSGVLAGTSVCFDLSVFELFAPLCTGGKVILADNALGLGTLPAASEVTLLNTVPSAMRELLRLKAVPPSVQVINLAGEALSCELVDQIYAQTAVRKVYDLYGPTETTTYSTGVLRRAGEPATIGKPLPNEQVYILDPQGQLTPVGVAGELHIGGVGLAREYLKRPELTAQKFIVHPFRAGERLYRTGDLARWRADGMLEYVGRMDHQVKIRGYRIELGEIEAVLRQVPQLREVLVVAREDRPGDKRLVAYVSAQGGQGPGVEELRAELRRQVPEYMVPSAFVFLEQWPLTPNGKVDRHDRHLARGARPQFLRHPRQLLPPRRAFALRHSNSVPRARSFQSRAADHRAV